MVHLSVGLNLSCLMMTNEFTGDYYMNVLDIFCTNVCVSVDREGSAHNWSWHRQQQQVDDHHNPVSAALKTARPRPQRSTRRHSTAISHSSTHVPPAWTDERRNHVTKLHATEERSRGQASQNKTTLQIATHNVRGTAKPQTTTETRTKQSLALHQKTTPSMLGRSSSTSVTRPKQAANSKLQRTVNSSCNDEVTIAFHKPTVTVSTQSASNNNNN